MTKRIFACLLALAIVAPVACSSGAQTGNSDGGRTSDESTRQVQRDLQLPDWLINVPDGGGTAFYAAGIGSFRSPALFPNGKQQAEAAARRQLADTIGTTVRGVTRRYMEQVITNEGDVAEEALSQDVMEAITNEYISGAEIIQYAQGYDENSGLYLVYALARLSFDAVAETMANEMRRRVQAVRDRAERAFDELRELTSEEAPKPGDPQDPAYYDSSVPQVTKTQTN